MPVLVHGPLFKSITLTIREWSKMDLSGQCVWRLSRNYFEPRKSEGMGGLHVDLEFPQGTDKSVHAFLKNAYFKWNLQKKSCKTTAKKCTNKVYCTCKVSFWLIWPIVVFHRSPALPSLLSITRFYILLEQTVNIIEIFGF